MVIYQRDPYVRHEWSLGSPNFDSTSYGELGAAKALLALLALHAFGENTGPM